MKFFLLSLTSFVFNFSFTQEVDEKFFQFKNFIHEVLLDTTNTWSEYPKPPKVTDEILHGLQKEIQADDSAFVYLDKLRFSKYSWSVDYENAFTYFSKNQYSYAVLVLSIHWLPDLRVSALIELNKHIKFKSHINFDTNKIKELEKFDSICIDFLIYVLENNPIFINGSENAAIHENYLTNLIIDLDLLTKKNIGDSKTRKDWYKNEKQIEDAINQWKKF